MFRRVHNRLFTLFNLNTVDINDSNLSRDYNFLSTLSPRPWNSLPSRKISGLSTPLSDDEQPCDIDELFETFWLVVRTPYHKETWESKEKNSFFIALFLKLHGSE